MKEVRVTTYKNAANLQSSDPAVRREISQQGVTARTSANMRRNGNHNAVRRYGLYSTRNGNKQTTRRISRLANRVWAALPWLQPSDEAIVRAWAVQEILAAEVFAHLDSEGLIDPRTGTVSKLLPEYRHLKNSLLKLEIQLGMTPSARAALGVDVARGHALDLASQIAEEKAKQGVIDDR